MEKNSGGETMKQEKLLLIPGPTPVHPLIINALSLPTVSHVSPALVVEFKEALENLKRIVFCQKGEPFIIAGAGTLAMEMALLNTVEKGEKMLILSQGYFGDRMAQIAKSFGLGYEIIQSQWGEAVTPEQMTEKLGQEKFAAVVSTHVDTATGACAPVREYAEILKDHECLYIIDGVCATGGMEERMDEWGVDVILTAAQKCFGAPPGLAILVLSETAMERRKRMEAIPAYYSDLMHWLPIMKDHSKYFSTPCVNEIRAFYESTKIILEEGMENRFNRHRCIARAIRAALKKMGFSFFTKEPYLADTLSVINYPQGIEDRSFRQGLNENGVVVAGGLADLAGKVFRIGHMGNLSYAQVYFALGAMERTLQSLGHKIVPGEGPEAARTILEEKTQ